MSIRTGKNLDVEMIIRTKCKKFDHLEWCGCLQPSEVVALYEAGYKPYLEDDIWVVNYAKDKKAKGEAGGSWYYFNIKPNSKMKKDTFPWK